MECQECAQCGVGISDAQAALSRARRDRAKPACQECVSRELTRLAGVIKDRAAIARTARNFRHPIRTALSLLDDIATNSDNSMGFDDIEDLCAARDVLARVLGVGWNADNNRYTEESDHDEA
jgi:hypothetical protein